MHDIEQALALQPAGEGVWDAVVPEGWGQGRTTFGGLVAGYLARAAESSTQRQVRGVDVFFLEPVTPGPVTVRLDSRRDGKYLGHLEASLWAAGKRAALGRFLVGDPGPGELDAVPLVPEPTTPFDQCVEMPQLPGLTPEFGSNLQILFGEGDWPYTGSQQAVTGGYVRNRGPARGVAALLTHIDAWPPPVLALTSRPITASTVRWHAQFHAEVAQADGEQWSWFRGESLWRSGSLATVTGSLVRDGRSVAYAEQTVAMYL